MQISFCLLSEGFNCLNTVIHSMQLPLSILDFLHPMQLALSFDFYPVLKLIIQVFQTVCRIQTNPFNILHNLLGHDLLL